MQVQDVGATLIDQQTAATILNLAGQYLVPAAALLRALWHGFRQKFPEGFSEIALASAFTGLTAVANNETLDPLAIILEILGNTVFMAGLLSFIMIYLLRQPNRGPWVDGFIGGFIGLVAWVVWTFILRNDYPWWTIPIAVVGGAVGFIVLRGLLRTIARVVRIATYFLVAAAVVVVLAGGVWLLTTVLNAPAVG